MLLLSRSRCSSRNILILFHMFQFLYLFTVFSRIEAAASICFLYFLVRFLFEGGFYSRAASIYRNSLSVIRQMALFRNFFHESGYNVIMG